MKVFKKLSKASGRIPGELIHVGEKKTDKIKINVIDYSERKLQEKEVDSIEEEEGWDVYRKVSQEKNIPTSKKCFLAYDLHP